VKRLAYGADATVHRAIERRRRARTQSRPDFHSLTREYLNAPDLRGISRMADAQDVNTLS